MNTELLFNLYAIHSPSGGEKKMRKFIRKYIAANCGDVTMETDRYGNLLCVKGEAETYPCLASHIDQVQRNHSKDFEVVSNGNVCFGYSPKSHQQQGLGADDKNGIFICLECLKAYDVLKVAFFVGEESGCVGSSDVNLEFFKDCRFVVEPDRRGSSDLITSMFCGDVCSKDFVKAIGAKRFGYKEEEGSVTDVGELVERGVGISCLNLSCGYYEAHTDEEFTVLPELENCLVFVMRIIEECRDVYPYEYEGRWYGGSSWYGGRYGSTKGYKSIPTAEYVADKDRWQGSGRYGGMYLNDEEEYYNEGYYDADLYTMEELLKTDPEISFDSIKANYMCDFNAEMFFFVGEEEDVVRGIYDDVKRMLNPETDEISFDDISLGKKIS